MDINRGTRHLTHHTTMHDLQHFTCLYQNVCAHLHVQHLERCHMFVVRQLNLDYLCEGPECKRLFSLPFPLALALALPLPFPLLFALPLPLDLHRVV